MAHSQPGWRDTSPLTSRTVVIYISRCSGCRSSLCCSIAKRKLMAVFVIPLHFKQCLILICTQPSLHHSSFGRGLWESGISRREPHGLCYCCSWKKRKKKNHLELTQKLPCHCEEYWMCLKWTSIGVLTTASEGLMGDMEKVFERCLCCNYANRLFHVLEWRSLHFLISHFKNNKGLFKKKPKNSLEGQLIQRQKVLSK